MTATARPPRWPNGFTSASLSAVSFEPKNIGGGGVNNGINLKPLHRRTRTVAASPSASVHPSDSIARKPRPLLTFQLVQDAIEAGRKLGGWTDGGRPTTGPRPREASPLTHE